MCLTEIIKTGFDCEENKPNAIHSLVGALGITETMLSKVKGDEYSNAQKLAEAKIEFAASSMVAEVMGYMTNQKLVSSTIDHRNIGIRKDGTKPASNRWGGVYGELCNDISVKVNIMSVTICVNHTGTIPLKFINLTTGESETVNVAVVSGVPKTIAPNHTFAAGMQRLKWAIGYDKTGITSCNTKAHGDCLDCSTKPKCGRHVWAWGAEFDSDGTDRTRMGHNSGLIVEFSITCDHEGLLCTNKELIALPMTYKVGEQLMVYARSSGRYNDEEKQKFEELLEYFGRRFHESMKLIVPRINVPNNECSSCYRQFGTKAILP